MTLTQINYILAVAEHRHFATAAETCHVTQPTLSMQIMKLEDELGVSIFDRSHQPVSLTEIGEQIIAQARVVAREAAKIQALVKAEQTEVNGEVHLGIIPTLAPYLLPLFVTKFVEKFPQVELVVEELQTQQIVEKLGSNRLDIGLLVTPLHNAGINEHVLFHEPFLVYLSKGHPLSKQKKLRERDLSADDVWLLNEGHCFRDQVMSLCGERSRKPTSTQSLRFESGNLETLRKMVDRSSGYTLLPMLAASELSAPAKDKQLREFVAPVPTREVALVHNRAYTRSAVVRAFMSTISETLPEDVLKLKSGSFHRVDMPPFR